MKPEEVQFGRRTVEPFRENVDPSDSRVLDLASRSIAFALQEIEDGVTKNRIAEYSALLRYFETAAQENGGVVPIQDIRDILTDALVAEK